MKKGENQFVGMALALVFTAIIVSIGVLIFTHMIPTGDINLGDASLKKISFAARTVAEGGCEKTGINLPSKYAITHFPSDNRFKLVNNDAVVLKSSHAPTDRTILAPTSRDTSNFLNAEEDPMSINHNFDKKVKGDICVCKLAEPQDGAQAGDIIILTPESRLGITECIL
jgi:hypothetical protein|tara:strand:+ start:347 stop:856 length:510 start_codon:yes stop_codon:yes gene_type:complete